ncbi:MAG: glucose-6-phosphate isomerase family protein [Candidatus Azambacteria bacterium]|nr:glucose-6-phosphate isomerase family protein [Candidatus Azambacteria bacterium]
MWKQKEFGSSKHMVDLQKISGLPIFLDEEKMNLEFNGDFQFIKKSERSLEELKPYLMSLRDISRREKNHHVDEDLDPVYYVWRYAHLKKDSEKIKEANLRYDLTLIPPGKIDSEFAKTAGHYHKKYPEIYEVLIGRAYFLIQSESAVYLAEVGPGEKFLVPPSFGHNTINVFNKPLLLANWISEKAIYDYKPYEENRGAMYYFIADGKMVDIIKNSNYGFTPEIKKILPKEYPEFGIFKNQPLYSLVDNLEKLKFLNYPEKLKLEI